MPMVWYIPPLSPIVDAVANSGGDGENIANLFGAIDAMRIPIEYLANLFTAGAVRPVRAVLDKLAAMRSYMRDINLGNEGNEQIASTVGMTGKQIQEMFRLLAIAKYDERYVIPPAHMEQAHSLEELATDCPVGEGGPSPAGAPVPVSIKPFAESKAGGKYLDWDGQGLPGGASR